MIRLGLNDQWNLQFGLPVHLISFAETVGRVPPSGLFQFIKLHPLLSKPLHAALYRFEDCAHHAAGYVIFAQLALHCIIGFIFIFRILHIVRTGQITHTVSDSIQHLIKCHFRLPGCQFWLFNIAHIFLLLLNRSLCIFNSLSVRRSLSLHLVLYPLLCLFIAEKVRLLFFFRHHLLFGSQAMQCCRASDPFCPQPSLPFSRLMTSSSGLLCRLAIFARPERRKVSFWSIDHCISCWLLLGERLDVARDGPYGCKLRLLCQGWYPWWTGTKQILGFDRP